MWKTSFLTILATLVAAGASAHADAATGFDPAASYTAADFSQCLQKGAKDDCDRIAAHLRKSAEQRATKAAQTAQIVPAVAPATVTTATCQGANIDLPVFGCVSFLINDNVRKGHGAGNHAETARASSGGGPAGGGGNSGGGAGGGGSSGGSNGGDTGGDTGGGDDGGSGTDGGGDTGGQDCPND